MTRLAFLLAACGLHAQTGLHAGLEAIIAERAAGRGFMGAVLVAKDGKILNHTCDIPSYTDIPAFATPGFRRTPLKPLEIAMLSKDKPLLLQQGEGYRYNNTGYVLLGHVIESVSGIKCDEYLEKNVFRPLEMNDSGYDWTRPVLRKRADGYGYNRDRKRYTNADFLDMSLPHAAGSLFSTVRDLYRWHQALLSGKLLSKDSYERMFNPGRNNYAYGWAVEERMAGSGSVTAAAYSAFPP